MFSEYQSSFYHKVQEPGQPGAFMKKTIFNGRGFSCPTCARIFHSAGNLSRHCRLECVAIPRFACPYCQMRSKYTQAIYRHIRGKHRDMELKFIKLY